MAAFSENSQSRIVQLLRDRLTELKLKSRGYSLRSFARRLGVPASALSEILSGKRSLTQTTGERIVNRLGLNPADYVDVVAALPPSRKRSVGRPEVLRHSALLSKAEFNLVSQWWYLAILSLADSGRCPSSPDAIAERFGITLTNSSNAVNDLKVLQLVYEKSGKLFSTGKKIFAGQEVPDPAIQQNHLQGLELASRALSEVSPLLREFGAMTMNVNLNRLPEAKARIRRFRAEMSELLDQGRVSEVYRLQIQLFPVTQKENS